MTPEASAYLDKAREHLAKADGMLAHWPDEAGRAAYLAGLQAARALIFEKTGRIAKTHKGVRAEFARLARTEPGFDDEARAFLGRAYALKEIADYLTGPGSRVSPELARQTIDMARRFVAAVVARLPTTTPKNGDIAHP